MRYLCNSRQLVCVAVWTCVCCGIDRAFISRRLTPHVAIELILACTYTTFPAPRAVLGQLAPQRLATTHRVPQTIHVSQFVNIILQFFFISSSMFVPISMSTYSPYRSFVSTLKVIIRKVGSTIVMECCCICWFILILF